MNLRPYLPGPALAGALLMLSVATMAAVALHLLVERPCNRLVRGRAPSDALQAPDP